MARYQVILAYNGSRYQGFQRQGQQPTVQGAVEDALHRLGWQGKTLLAAGRTDTGVHASGQVIAFDLEWSHGTQALQAALNALMPADLAARSVQQAADDFHPRYNALARSYRYSVYCDAIRHPLVETGSWRVWPCPSLELLNKAASLLSGEHDFAGFGSPLRSGGSTIRRVWQAGWMEANERLYFDVTANAFLYRMVRRMVYAQVMVGLGRLELDCIQRALDEPGSCPFQGLAPAQGLTLVNVQYG